jgi:hypothetical protein
MVVWKQHRVGDEGYDLLCLKDRFANSEGKTDEHEPGSRRVFLTRSVEELDLNPGFRHSKHVERI